MNTPSRIDPDAAVADATAASAHTPRDKQLADTFPASDPPSTTAPHAPAQRPAHPHAMLYRVVSADQADRAFAREAVPKQGRWTSPGRCVVYASASPACAVLEFVAHLGDEPPPRELRLAVASVPADCCLSAQRLPRDWHRRPYREHVRRIGDGWLDRAESFALWVPSALSPRERNVLLNLDHADAGRLQVLAHDALSLDRRLSR